MRNGIFNTFYFGIYNSILPQLQKHNDHVPEFLLKVYILLLLNTERIDIIRAGEKINICKYVNMWGI